MGVIRRTKRWQLRCSGGGGVVYLFLLQEGKFQIFSPPFPNSIRSALACMFRSRLTEYAPRVAMALAAMNELPRNMWSCKIIIGPPRSSVQVLVKIGVKTGVHVVSSSELQRLDEAAQAAQAAKQRHREQWAAAVSRCKPFARVAAHASPPPAVTRCRGPLVLGAARRPPLRRLRLYDRGEGACAAAGY
jgi:hypothetical protein